MAENLAATGVLSAYYLMWGMVYGVMCWPDSRLRLIVPDTGLTGALSDQAALYGVLAEIEALGLECQRPLRNPVGWSWFLRAGGHQNSRLVAACSPGGRGQVASGITPLPVRASASRCESPLVRTRRAWCRSRSTVAVARVFAALPASLCLFHDERSRGAAQSPPAGQLREHDGPGQSPAIDEVLHVCLCTRELQAGDPGDRSPGSPAGYSQRCTHLMHERKCLRVICRDDPLCTGRLPYALLVRCGATSLVCPGTRRQRTASHHDRNYPTATSSGSAATRNSRIPADSDASPGS
jgi:hypothetical protein